MPTIDYSPVEITTRGDNCHIVTWSTLTNGDDGAPVQMPGSADRTVQVFGTFGAGGNVRIEGSNDGLHWSALRDAVHAELDVTAESIRQVLEVVRYMRPRVTAGDGTTSLTVVMLVRRAAR